MPLPSTQLSIIKCTWDILKDLGINSKAPTHRAVRAGKRNAKHSITSFPVVSGPGTFLSNTPPPPPEGSDENKTYGHKVDNSIIKNSVHMCVINAQSVCNKTDLLTDHFIENKFDIIAITETWLSYSDAHKRVIGNLSLPGYNFIHVPRENRPGGGLAVIFKDNIQKMQSSSHQCTSFESLCCDFSLKQNCSSLRLVVVYRPPYSEKNRCTPKVFMDEFADYLELLVSSSSKLLIVGDFNFQWNQSDNSNSH